MRVTVQDDGVGFEPLQDDDGENHLGIRSVRMRIEDIPGASFRLESEKNKGTTAQVVLPLRHHL